MVVRWVFTVVSWCAGILFFCAAVRRGRFWIGALRFGFFALLCAEVYFLSIYFYGGGIRSRRWTLGDIKEKIRLAIFGFLELLRLLPYPKLAPWSLEVLITLGGFWICFAFGRGRWLINAAWGIFDFTLFAVRRGGFWASRLVIRGPRCRILRFAWRLLLFGPGNPADWWFSKKTSIWYYEACATFDYFGPGDALRFYPSGGSQLLIAIGEVLIFPLWGNRYFSVLIAETHHVRFSRYSRKDALGDPSWKSAIWRI